MRCFNSAGNKIILSLLCSTFLFSPVANAEESAPTLNSLLGGSSIPYEASSAIVSSKSKLVARLAHVSRRKSSGRPSNSQFAGSWYSRLSLKKSTCAPGISALSVGLRIDSSLNGKDIFDGSPFFTGRVLASNRIGFGRKRAANGCEQTQLLVIGNINGSRGDMVVQSDTRCGVNSCTTLFAGAALRK